MPDERARRNTVIDDGTRPSRKKRPRAPHRRLAAETRRILIAHGGPMRAADIVRRLPPELRATVGDASRLPRILRRSRRGGLTETPDGWWVRKRWLRKRETERVPDRPRSQLARTRGALDAACARAFDLLKACATAVPVAVLLRQLADPGLDERLFKRAMWNRAKADQPVVRLEKPASYRWIG